MGPTMRMGVRSAPTRWRTAQQFDRPVFEDLDCIAISINDGARLLRAGIRYPGVDGIVLVIGSHGDNRSRRIGCHDLGELLLDPEEFLKRQRAKRDAAGASGATSSAA